MVIYDLMLHNGHQLRCIKMGLNVGRGSSPPLGRVFSEPGGYSLPHPHYGGSCECPSVDFSI